MMLCKEKEMKLFTLNNHQTLGGVRIIILFFFKYKALKPCKNEIVLKFSCLRHIFDYDTHYDRICINVTILPKNKTL